MSMKVVIVTGASKGIGLAAVRTLLTQHQCAVVTLSRTLTSGLNELKTLHTSRLHLVSGDVSNDADQKRAVDLAIESFGRLDGLLLNAGVWEPVGRVADADLHDWKSHFDVNFFSLVSMLQLSMPALRKSKGKVVFTSSGAATGNYTAWGAYNASKAALNSLCRTVASEESDVTFLAVRPGVVDTDMQSLLREVGGDHMAPAEHQKFLDLHTKGSLLPPEKPAGVLAALCVNDHHSLSGQFVNWEDNAFADYH